MKKSCQTTKTKFQITAHPPLQLNFPPPSPNDEEVEQSEGRIGAVLLRSETAKIQRIGEDDVVMILQISLNSLMDDIT